MAHSSQGVSRHQEVLTPFLSDKQAFLNQYSGLKTSPEHLKTVAKAARQHDYAFLSSQYFPMEEELRHLYHVLSGETFVEEKDLWLYCYYCCIMLSEYHKDHNYGNLDKHHDYLNMAQDIESLYTEGKLPKKQLRTWTAHLKADIDDLLSTPFHVSKLRNWIAFANVYRIVFTFSRLTDQEFFRTVNAWSRLLPSHLHFSLDLDAINRNINGPTATFRALSVGLFIGRLLINMGLVIKHTCFPTAGEKTIPISARFYQEIKKRYPQLLNDLVWAVTNALTNYAAFFHVSNPLANVLLVAGLGFDFSLLAYRLREATRDNETKLKQYNFEKQILETQLKTLLKSADANPSAIAKTQQHLACIEAQIKEQAIKMEVIRANFYANLLAATLIASGFSLSILAAAPLAVCLSYLIIVVGSALYVTADHYSGYREKVLRQATAEDTAQAFEKFSVSMLKNTAMPLLVMGTLAFSWPAALLLLTGFVVCEYHFKYAETNAAYKAQSLFARQEKSTQETSELNEKKAASAL